MDIDGLLASTAMVDQGGARTLTDRGELVYDLAALTEALRLRHADVGACSQCRRVGWGHVYEWGHIRKVPVHIEVMLLIDPWHWLFSGRSLMSANGWDSASGPGSGCLLQGHRLSRSAEPGEAAHSSFCCTGTLDGLVPFSIRSNYRPNVNVRCHCRYLKQAAPGQTGGADDDTRREACRLALAFAQRWNAWLEEAGAQAAAVRGWQAVIEVAFTRRRGIENWKMSL